MRKDIQTAKPTCINVSNKEKVNMKLSVACNLLWSIKVDGGYDIKLNTTWVPLGSDAPLALKDYGNVASKTDRMSISGA